MKATLRFHEKYRLHDFYLIEMTLHEVADLRKYPEGLKYGLLCMDLRTGKRLLMDNHHPKGDHIHLDDLELPYKFKSVERLIEDFNLLAFEHLGVRL